MNLVIVESAAKAKTINKYLGDGYRVLASYGHVRDLPSKDGSVEPENDFEMHWNVEGDSRKVLSEITEAVKKADKLILATDPDREGEAISWHIVQVLSQKKALKKGLAIERVAFNAVTKQAILAALAAPRKIDEPLVSAYLARRALDYLVGFTLSPVLWRKLPGARSAGRVQSVALRLVCDREAEIEAFRPQEYWTVEALLLTDAGEEVRARLASVDGAKLGRLAITDGAQARAIVAALQGQPFTVESVEKKAVRRNPPAPFTTSTLQQEASRKLGFSAKETMQIAQRLYEGLDIGGETVGLITYMRTDGVQIVPEAIHEIRKVIAARFTPQYVPPFVREYKTKAKNAQEAHEAIRPTSAARTPEDVARHLAKEQAALYDLVWRRALASQMASAEIEQTTADITAQGTDGRRYGFRATGSIVMFDGFLKLYEEGRDDEEDETARRLPPLAAGGVLRTPAEAGAEALALDLAEPPGLEAHRHVTEPPPRYSEATLVKRMEELGIGRPSTYASTLAVLRERGYVRLDRKRLVPEDKGRLVTAFLESFFDRYVEYGFTADLEEKLDLISDGKLVWKDVLKDFWRDFTAAVEGIKDLRVGDVLEALNGMLGPHIFPPRPDGKDPRLCPLCGTGRLSLKISGKYGAFIGCGNYPECRYTRQLADQGNAGENALPPEGKILGQDPQTGQPVTLRSGRFGPYIQLGEAADGEKPKRASVPKGMDAGAVDLGLALRLLSLPREVGLHPGTQKPVTAGIGRFGPFVQHDGTYANLENLDEVFTVGINRAVTLLAEKKAGAGGRRRAAARKVLRDLGEHPETGGRIEILEGRYGPYVTHNKVNATLPKDTDPQKLTVEDAVALLSARAAKGGKSVRKAAAKGKAAATATEKAAAPRAKKGAAKDTSSKGTAGRGSAREAKEKAPARTVKAKTPEEKKPARKAPAKSAKPAKKTGKSATD